MTLRLRIALFCREFAFPPWGALASHRGRAGFAHTVLAIGGELEFCGSKGGGTALSPRYAGSPGQILIKLAFTQPNDSTPL